MKARWAALGVLGCLAAFGGCSSSSDNAGSNGGNGASGNIGPIIGAGATGPGTDGLGNACNPSESSSECSKNSYSGEYSSLDIYIMFDQSCSMSCPAERTGLGLCCTGGPNPRIDLVRSAVKTFLQDPQSAGIGVGIGYFGNMQPGNTSCDPSQYSTPSVTIGALPGQAPAIINSVSRVTPTGETPTGAAIRGACTYASQWQSAHPTHATVVLLVTDGVPEAPVTSRRGTCSSSLPDAVQAAQTCMSNNPALHVYVLGVGHQLDNLNQIAAAGGTKQAYLVDGADPNVTGSVLKALNAIRADASIPCQLKLTPPAGQTLDVKTVNVQFCNGQKQSETFYYVNSANECDPAQGGWYYDNAAKPSQVMLCPTTCDKVTVPGGQLVLSFGCATVPLIH